MSDKTYTGGCHCGAVKYKATGPLRDIVICHCGECQRLNGSAGWHSRAMNDRLSVTEDRGLAWYQITDRARRGYCRECGSPLFWQIDEQDSTGIVAGSLDDASDIEPIGHIFVRDKAPYYAIDDDLPRFEQSSDGALQGDFD
jgi:hypothetical protein